MTIKTLAQAVITNYAAGMSGFDDKQIQAPIEGPRLAQPSEAIPQTLSLRLTFRRKPEPFTDAAAAIAWASACLNCNVDHVEAVISPADASASRVSELETALLQMWAFASLLVSKHGMDGDDTLSDKMHADWQDAGSKASNLLGSKPLQTERRDDPARAIGAIVNAAAGLIEKRIAARSDRHSIVNETKQTGPLHEAVAALKLASECGGELDLERYKGAFDGLVEMRDEIRAYDACLDKREQAPTGDDYNQLLSILHLT